MTPALDDDVVEGVRSARPDALAVVYQRCAGPLLGWLCSQGLDHGAAEEVVEDTFLDLVRDCRRIRGDGNALRSWLFTAARRNLIDHRRAVHRDRSVSTDRLPEVVASDAAPEDVVTGRLTSGPLADALDRLSPAQRETIALRYLADLPVADVAAVTGRSPAAVRQLLVTGRRSLAAALASAESRARSCEEVA